MNGRRIVAVQQHVAAPVAHADNEQLDLKIAGRLLRENLKDPLLRILVLYVVGKAVIGPKRHSRRCKRVVAIGSTADKLRRRA